MWHSQSRQHENHSVLLQVISGNNETLKCSEWRISGVNSRRRHLKSKQSGRRWKWRRKGEAEIRAVTVETLFFYKEINEQRHKASCYFPPVFVFFVCFCPDDIVFFLQITPVNVFWQAASLLCGMNVCTSSLWPCSKAGQLHFALHVTKQSNSKSSRDIKRTQNDSLSQFQYISV